MFAPISKKISSFSNELIHLIVSGSFVRRVNALSTHISLGSENFIFLSSYLNESGYNVTSDNKIKEWVQQKSANATEINDYLTTFNMYAQII